MINRSLFFLLAAVLLAACSGQKQDSKNISQDSSPIAVTPVEAENKVTAKKDSTVPSIMEGHELPEDCFFTGNFKEAWTWYDLNGKNILLLSSREKSWKEEEMDETANTKELYARHYIQKESGSELFWELYDLEKDCIFDLTAEFLFSPQFSDLDNDGIKESTLAYKLACRSDVSPARMKIVMHENKNKYALRGVMYIAMNPDEDRTDIGDWEPDLSKSKVNKDDYTAAWGKYENAKDFEKAPPAFLEHAITLWQQCYQERLN